PQTRRKSSLAHFAPHRSYLQPILLCPIDQLGAHALARTSKARLIRHAYHLPKERTRQHHVTLTWFRSRLAFLAHRVNFLASSHPQKSACWTITPYGKHDRSQCSTHSK